MYHNPLLLGICYFQVLTNFCDILVYRSFFISDCFWYKLLTFWVSDTSLFFAPDNALLNCPPKRLNRKSFCFPLLISVRLKTFLFLNC